MTLTQPLKWHGGKFYLAKKILNLFPPHTHYVEPYFGGGSVLLQKPSWMIEGYSEVVNDLNGELTNFWQVLRDAAFFREFIRRVEATPFSEHEWENPSEPATEVERAANFFVRYRQSRQGLGSDFATLSRNRTRRGMNEQVSSWLSAIEGLPEIHARLQRVVILNRDALSVITSQDGPNTFFYLDPPYLHETRVSTDAYECEMTEDQHRQLLIALAKIEGKFLLSGYHSRLYDKTAKYYNWHLAEIEIDNKASSKKIKDTKTECLWRNYK